MTFHNRVIITVHAYLVYLAIDLSLHLLSFSSFIVGVMHAYLNGNHLHDIADLSERPLQ